VATIDILKSVYRTLIPKSVRQSERLVRLKSKILPHQWIYDASYYSNDIEGAAATSAPIIASSILERFAPRTVMDVGCGTGALLEEFRNRGCKVAGLEYSDAALAYCRQRELDVTRFNLEEDTLSASTPRFDVVLSLEVAEHIPESAANRYVGVLSQLASVVAISAAPPGQGGTDHVNEQQQSYWISMFRLNGLVLEKSLTMELREEWESSGVVADYYFRNLMLFRFAD